MATVSSESLNSFHYSDTELNGMEISETDAALLMALLEESHVEEAEDERLTSVIQSLKEEIDRCDEDVISDDIWDCSGSSMSGFDDSIDWTDIDMTSTSLSDGMENNDWYASSIENEFVVMADFKNSDINNNIYFSQMASNIADYSQFSYADDHEYSSLWQETYDSSMYS
ncbi:hypothetical protein FRX31_005408 [Thalictrum thalictroides]|uniref:Uncharacterized protein n=1 Tax=Thalictrum thalictroides TaxID=46969 RepID=A0A7J6X7Y3_THATH|nr:hypothetical protein FRX31_005408 [Thalictrum thalictroides]